MGIRFYVCCPSFNTAPDSPGAAFAAFSEVTEVFLPTDRGTGRCLSEPLCDMRHDEGTPALGPQAYSEARVSDSWPVI